MQTTMGAMKIAEMEKLENRLVILEARLGAY
jgi:hypothetical protein